MRKIKITYIGSIYLFLSATAILGFIFGVGSWFQGYRLSRGFISQVINYQVIQSYFWDGVIYYAIAMGAMITVRLIVYFKTRGIKEPNVGDLKKELNGIKTEFEKLKTEEVYSTA